MIFGVVWFLVIGAIAFGVIGWWSLLVVPLLIWAVLAN